MDELASNVRIAADTQKKLRMIYAITGDSMMNIVGRLVEVEYRKVMKKEQEKLVTPTD